LTSNKKKYKFAIENTRKLAVILEKSGKPMKFIKSYILFIITLNVIDANGQIASPDSIQKWRTEFKTYLKEHTPKLDFDSARFSTNGQYALIYEGSYLNGCIIHYWTLYNAGLNKPLQEYIAIIKDSVYFITYDNIKAKYFLTGIQTNGNIYTWNISEKYKLKEFISKYGLHVKPIDKTEFLIINIDTLSPINKKIPAEKSLESIGDSVVSLLHLAELKVIFNNKILFLDTITFLPDPMYKEYNFNYYLIRLRKQVLEKKLCEDNEYGKYFSISKNNYFLKLNVESYIFSGWNFLVMKNEEIIITSISSDKNANINLFKSNNQ